MYTITTEPKVGIGQRAFFLQTPSGNVLWDLIAYLDEETVEFIQRKGGLKAIVISHPHYYTTHLDWARTFGCPVYVAREDEEWLCQKDEVGVRKFIEGQREVIVDGIEAIKVGGHFPGSLVLLWEKKLFIADTIVTTPVRLLSSATASMLTRSRVACITLIDLKGPTASSSCGPSRI